MDEPTKFCVKVKDLYFSPNFSPSYLLNSYCMFLAHKNTWTFLFLFFLFIVGVAQRGLDSTDAEIRVVKVEKLNSEYRETNVCISPTGDYIFWQSPRGGQSWSVKRNEIDLHGMSRFDGDIWYAVRQENGDWSTPLGLNPRSILPIMKMNL